MHVFKIAVYAVVLLAKTPGLLLGCIYRRSDGARAFRQELLRAGMDTEQAALLTKSYKKMFMPEWNELFRRVKRIRTTNTADKQG